MAKKNPEAEKLKHMLQDAVVTEPTSTKEGVRQYRKIERNFEAVQKKNPNLVLRFALHILKELEEFNADMERYRQIEI